MHKQQKASRAENEIQTSYNKDLQYIDARVKNHKRGTSFSSRKQMLNFSAFPLTYTNVSDAPAYYDQKSSFRKHEFINGEVLSETNLSQ